MNLIFIAAYIFICYNSNIGADVFFTRDNHMSYITCILILAIAVVSRAIATNIESREI